MKFAVHVHPFGELAEPSVVLGLARAAEKAGWDGFYLADETGKGLVSSEPWTMLAAVAAVTARIRIGAAVTPLPRRGAHLFAQELATLDRLSSGRLTLVCGIGGNREMHQLGIARDSRIRTAAADEQLEVMTRLWAGETVTCDTDHVVLNEAAVDPGPLQRPRIPVWIGGWTRDARKRAAKWDGWAMTMTGKDGEPRYSADQMAKFMDEVDRWRSSESLPDIAVAGRAGVSRHSSPAAYRDAGVTWWLEAIGPAWHDPDEAAGIVAAGPPATR